jgi:hypothetical protein
MEDKVSLLYKTKSDKWGKYSLSIVKVMLSVYCVNKRRSSLKLKKGGIYIKGGVSKIDFCVCNKAQTWVGVVNTDIWQQYIYCHHQKERILSLHSTAPNLCRSVNVHMFVSVLCMFLHQSCFPFRNENPRTPIKQQTINL